MNARMDNWAKEAERRFNEQQQAMIAENDAQRRLRDAAPDLLAALEDIVQASDANDGDSLMNAIQAAQTIITKAKPNVKNPIDL